MVKNKESVNLNEPPDVALFLVALVPPERLTTLKKQAAPFTQGPKKVASFTDSPGRLPIGVVQAVKVWEVKTASRRP